ncbi:MAG: DUF5684 domain-containing protein [Candidatus Promineifilaceae bacterium]
MFKYLLFASVLFQNDDAGALIVPLFASCCGLIFAILMVAAQWKIFTKAGKPGWAAIIPIYNFVIYLEIVGRPLWFIVLFFIPFVNFIALILLMLDLAASFGKDMIYAILLILFPYVMLLVLAFSDAQYVGPMAAKNPIFPAN